MKKYRILYNGYDYRIQYKDSWFWWNVKHYYCPDSYNISKFPTIICADEWIQEDIQNQKKLNAKYEIIKEI